MSSKGQASIAFQAFPGSRVLIVRACAIGDFVLNLPAIRALAIRNPEARFTLVGYPSIVALAKHFLPVDAVHSIETQPWSRLFSDAQPGLSFDAAVVWMKQTAFAENLRESGVPAVHQAQPFPEANTNIHAAAHLLNTLGLPEPELPDSWSPGSDRVLIQPGSGSPRKCWPHFERLAAELPNVAAIIGPCEEEFKGVCPQLRLSLTEVVAELRRCRLFIGNDSGITRLAAYLGCPTIALFGPTDPRVWGPVGRRVEVLWKSALSDISVEEITAKIMPSR